MRLTRYYLPTLKETPSDAQIVSHRLMLRCGMIRQVASGIYNWLPLGHRVLKKIENIVRQEQDDIGAHEMLMPTIQPADLWRQSGRYDDYGQEMLRLSDRHGQDLLYGPTNEEVITALVRESISSYRQLPQLLYHIQWKFRDEIRPRFGVMRGREFLMKDAYSFDMDYESSVNSYHKMFLSYCRIFHRLGLKTVPMVADTGPIGGQLSHEFIVLAQTGESNVFLDQAWFDKDLSGRGIDMNCPDELKKWVDEILCDYAATEEKHDEKSCASDCVLSQKGIEVGHIFHFGTKYSKAMGAHVQIPQKGQQPIFMGSYGIGMSRLVGALMEAFHDDHGMVWPMNTAPFHVGLVNLRPDDEDFCHPLCEKIYQQCQNMGLEVLYDERSVRGGVKFSDMDLIGLPWQIIVGPKDAKESKVCLKNRRTNEREDMDVASCLERLRLLGQESGVI